MIALRRHDPEDYAKLPDIDSANVGSLDDSDQACLDDIGQFLLRSKANLRFGVGLLHSHFTIESDETVVENICTDGETIILRPTKNAVDVLPTALCFDESSSDEFVRLVGLEFADTKALAGAIPIGDWDHEVLAKLGDILRRHEKIERFGIRLLHDPIGLSGRVLLETCDATNRVLSCRAIAEDAADFNRSIPTVFSWQETGTEEGPTINQGCMQYCKSIQRCSVNRNGDHRSDSRHDSSHGRGP
jgi:hypothetical protein